MITVITWVLVAINTILAILLGLKVWDAIRAWRYNRRMAQARAVAEAYEIGKRFALGAYSGEVRVPAYIVRTTPDRPEPNKYWGGKSVEDICRELESMEILRNYSPPRPDLGDIGGQL